MVRSALNTLTERINKFSNQELISKCLLSYLIIKSLFLDLVYVFPILIFILLFVFIDKSYFQKPLFWGSVILLLIPHLFVNYFSAANHFFITIYILIILCISSIFKNDQEHILRLNAKYILAVLMIFAVIQKLISEEFMSGQTIGYMGYTGQLFKLPTWFFPEIKDAVGFNHQQINKEILDLPVTFSLKQPFPYFKEFSLLFTYITIFAEIIFAALLFVKSEFLKNSFFALFVFALILTRQETGFILLVSILLMMQLKDKSALFKTIYFGLFILSLGLTIVQWGFV